jgi:large subunit ribosomal protein L4
MMVEKIKKEIKKIPKTDKKSESVLDKMESVVYDQKGKEVGKVTLPETIFGVKWNADLVHQVVTSMMSSIRNPFAHTKNRGEVSGGGKKPWQQKGTGRARHGSSRSPIWRHGGVTHGPRNDKNFDRKVNKKMKAKALYAILTAKFKRGQILFVDSLNFKEPKTKIAKEIITSLSKVTGFNDMATRSKNALYIALSEKKIIVEKSFSNFNTLEVGEIRNLSPLDLMKYKYILIENPEKSLASISSKLQK